MPVFFSKCVHCGCHCTETTAAEERRFQLNRGAAGQLGMGGFSRGLGTAAKALTKPNLPWQPEPRQWVTPAGPALPPPELPWQPEPRQWATPVGPALPPIAVDQQRQSHAPPSPGYAMQTWPQAGSALPAVGAIPAAQGADPTDPRWFLITKALAFGQ